RGAAPDRHEEEQAPSRGTAPSRELVDRGQIVYGLPRDQGVDLEREPGFARRLGGPQCPVEAAGHAAERVMPRGGGGIEAQRDRLDASLPQPPDDRRGDQRGGARSPRTPESGLARGGDEPEEVDTLERIAARQNQVGRRMPGCGEPADDGRPL